MSATAQASPWGRARPASAPPLLDLLGARWTMDVAVTGVAWDGVLAGFSLGDGSIAVARSDWDGAPRVGPRDGGMEVTPASAPPPPVSRQRAHEGSCLAIAADPSGGFLSGGDDGRLIRMAADGTLDTLGQFPGHWVELVATGRAGLSAASAGRQVHVIGPSGSISVLDLPASATALVFDAAGRRLAVAHYRGATVWSLEADGTRLLTTRGFPRSIAWSPDGKYIVCGLQEKALHGWRLADGGDLEMGGYPGQPRSVAFSADGRFLASSGGPRVVCWRFDPPQPEQAPAECGLAASRMPVCRVACHPLHTLVAAGYQNGAVLLCQPGTDDVLFARASGIAAAADPADAAIAALAWSADGQRLAMATAGGEIGVLALPERLFRFGSPPGIPSSPRVAS